MTVTWRRRGQVLGAIDLGAELDAVEPVRLNLSARIYSIFLSQQNSFNRLISLALIPAEQARRS